MKKVDVDVLCLGLACHDLVFDIDHHPGPDEKTRASAMVNCGGGLAANAAIASARLGYETAFVGYLGTDSYGEMHMAEFHADGVNTDWVVRGTEPTPLSAIMVKPDGQRAIVHYRGESEGTCANHFDLNQLSANSILVDGNQFSLAQEVVQYAKENQIPTIIDADSLKPQTEALVQIVDYVVTSERFAYEYSDHVNVEAGLDKLATVADNVVVTLGERGLIWRRGSERGSLDAFAIKAMDTTGAGDAFHGAFAAGVAADMDWDRLLRFASAVGALCCTKQGGRVGIPNKDEVEALLAI